MPNEDIMNRVAALSAGEGISNNEPQQNKPRIEKFAFSAIKNVRYLSLLSMPVRA